MRNKLAYLLLAKNSQDNKKEIENAELPVTFSGNGHRLRNYKIYGNTVQGKNLFNGELVSGYYSDSTMTTIMAENSNYRSKAEF